MEGWQACGRTIRGCARRCIHGREHVFPRHRCVKSLPGSAGRTPAKARLYSARYPISHTPSSHAGGDRDSPSRLRETATEGPTVTLYMEVASLQVGLGLLLDCRLGLSSFEFFLAAPVSDAGLLLN